MGMDWDLDDVVHEAGDFYVVRLTAGGRAGKREAFEVRADGITTARRILRASGHRARDQAIATADRLAFEAEDQGRFRAEPRPSMGPPRPLAEDELAY